MRRVSTVIVCWSSLLAAALAQAGSQPRSLQPIDMFRLDYLMVASAEDPTAWLDGERYLVFDAGPRAQPGQGRKAWQVVEARTGSRQPWLDQLALRRELLKLLGDGGEIDEALQDLEHWTWSADYERCVLRIRNDLFAADRGGAAVRLTATPDLEESIVQFSPDGLLVAFVAGNDLQVVPAAGGEVRKLTDEGHDDLLFGKLDWVYQEELYGRGNFRGYWWSPDSRHIALLRLDESPVGEFILVSDVPARPAVERTNYPKTGEPNPIAAIGTIDVATGEQRWFDLARYPEDDRLIVRVTWAPDGGEVLFQVQNREQTWLDMLAGDPSTGALRTLWREDSDCWVEAGPEPIWLDAGESFLWLSERTGFRHLYHFARDGRQLAQLTDGRWQVKEVVGVDAAAGIVYLTADLDSPVQTHLYRLPLAGEAPRRPERITSGRGTHDVLMAKDHRTFVSRWSSAEEPPGTSLRDLAGRELRAIATSRPQLLAPFRLSAPEFVQVPARDGFSMEGMLIKPRDFSAERQYPVVQFTYSGPHTPRVRDSWGGRDYLWHQLLAQRGYLVFVCDNRSASGKGREYAKACWRRLGHSELQDLEDSVDWLVAQGNADRQRIAIWGWSYGGYQTLYNLTHSDKWRCGVAVNAVTDWLLYDTIYTERYAGLPANNQQGYEASSVVNAAGNLRGALLLVAAAMDDNVHMQNSLQFLHALQQAQKDCDFVVYPRVRHGIEDLQQQLHLFARFERFLRERL